jgi:glutamyl-tRNA synthetase
MPTATPVTRFAPSPTGFLHIGGARTALFNLLFARANGGKFLLRIEDTDRSRSTDAAIAAILDGMAWLDMQPDEPPVLQFARAARHADVAHALVASGGAYRCYASADELETMRAEQKAAGHQQRYDGRWRDRAPGPAQDGMPFVVRLRAPADGATTIDDAVQGSVTVANAEIDDFVLLRSDGTPTYMLAVVVDDHDAAVSHVIRGDDHLNNAFRQLALIRALGWPEPVYAHVPMIHGPDGAKLSKRHGALGVDAYRDALGILPEALENYLLRLGWGHGDAELLTRTEAVAVFSLADIGRSPARFDLAKLESVNAHYLRQADDTRLTALLLPRLAALAGRDIPADQADLVQRSMAELKQRAKNLNDLASSAEYLVRSRPLALDGAAQKLLENDGARLLLAARDVLAVLPDWTREAAEAAIAALAAERGIGLGKVAGPLRAALTGRTSSPSVFAMLAVFGRSEALGRIDDALAGGITAR